jgi:hypothetical protein
MVPDGELMGVSLADSSKLRVSEADRKSDKLLVQLTESDNVKPLDADWETVPRVEKVSETELNPEGDEEREGVGGGVIVKVLVSEAEGEAECVKDGEEDDELESDNERLELRLTLDESLPLSESEVEHETLVVADPVKLRVKE